MRKLLYFVPALTFTVLTLCLNLIMRALLPLWHIWNILFWLSGWQMSRGRVWGCVPGLLPAASVMILNAGNPMGIACMTGLGWAIYYIFCGFFVYKARRKK